MKHVRHHLLVAPCLAVLALSAGAQTPAPAAPAPGMPMPGHPVMMMQQHMQQHMQERRAQRQAALKQILQITAAQESAWNAWIASRQPSGQPRPSRADLAQLPTPERIDRLRALRATRNAEMDRRAEATKTFYAALTPSQQKAFDALIAQRMGRGFGGGHHGWGHHRG